MFLKKDLCKRWRERIVEERLAGRFLESLFVIYLNYFFLLWKLLVIIFLFFWFRICLLKLFKKSDCF